MSEKLNRVGGDKAVRETLTNHLFYTEGCVWLVLDPVWIGLTEQVLIAVYRPIWNSVVDGLLGTHCIRAVRGPNACEIASSALTR